KFDRWLHSNVFIRCMGYAPDKRYSHNPNRRGPLVSCQSLKPMWAKFWLQLSQNAEAGTALVTVAVIDEWLRKGFARPAALGPDPDPVQCLNRRPQADQCQVRDSSGSSEFPRRIPVAPLHRTS